MTDQSKSLLPGSMTESLALAPAPRGRTMQTAVLPLGPTVGGDVQRVITVLQRHWRAALAFAVVVFAAVSIATWLMRPVYEPEGMLQIDPPGNEVFSLQNTPGVSSDSEYI